MDSKMIVQADNNVKRIEELSGKEVMIHHRQFLDFGKKVDKNEAREYLKIDKAKKILLFF